MPAPPTPAAPTLIWSAPAAARIQWAAVTAVPAVDTWEVRWRTTPAGSYQTRAGIGADQLAATISDLDSDTEHEFSVRAVNTDGNSGWSPALTATTQQEDTMAILQADLTEVQIGIEGTAGTLVAATRKIPYQSGSYRPLIERETLEERGTVLADTADVVVRRGSELELTETLNTETLIAALRCSLAAVASTNLSGARRWLFTPAVTAPSGLDTATIEIAATDGAGTDTYHGRFGFARATSIGIEASAGTAQLTTTWMGRARQPLTAPAAVTAPSRWLIPAAGIAVYVDDTWGGLGTTQLGTARSVSLDIDPGLAAAEALAGRGDLDASYWRRGRIRGSLSTVVDHDGSAAGELGHWEAGDLRYIRLEATNGLTGAALRRLRIDACTRYIDTPDVIAADGPQHTLDLASMLRADAAGNILAVEVVNGIDTW